ncbi:MAG TPA: GNAT family N-acetyltransferase [Dehalococcoidia bacterium]|nr:GNAT family N-acetyltransferase [Dehalococcoidia bacterium]
MAVWARPTSLRQFREGWLRTPQAETLIRDIADSMNDLRTAAEIWEEDGKPVGFLWLTFSESELPGQSAADVRTLVVAPEHQRRGIGGLMLRHAEQQAQVLGATALRSETAYDNEASRAMHGRLGFKVVSYQYEKLLTANSA